MSFYNVSFNDNVQWIENWEQSYQEKNLNECWNVIKRISKFSFAFMSHLNTRFLHLYFAYRDQKEFILASFVSKNTIEWIFLEEVTYQNNKYNLRFKLMFTYMAVEWVNFFLFLNKECP